MSIENHWEFGCLNLKKSQEHCVIRVFKNKDLVVKECKCTMGADSASFCVALVVKLYEIEP